jgi:hypothetical protein
MEKRQFFPYIFTRKMGSFVEGIICIGLKSILKGDLMIPIQISCIIPRSITLLIH